MDKNKLRAIAILLFTFCIECSYVYGAPIEEVNQIPIRRNISRPPPQRLPSLSDRNDDMAIGGGDFEFRGPNDATNIESTTEHLEVTRSGANNYTNCSFFFIGLLVCSSIVMGIEY